MGIMRFLFRTLTFTSEPNRLVDKVLEEKDIVKGIQKYSKEYFCEDFPVTSISYQLGHKDGTNDGINKASAEYEKKLADQADEFIRQKELLKQETEKYEKLIDDMEGEIEALENKLNRSEEENRALKLLIQKLNELKQAYS